MKYITIPVDKETHRQVMILLRAYEMPTRAQGALVSKLVRAEYDKLVDAIPRPSASGTDDETDPDQG